MTKNKPHVFTLKFGEEPRCERCGQPLYALLERIKPTGASLGTPGSTKGEKC